MKKSQTEILRILHDLYPTVKCALDFSTPFELAVAVILSAQCTDVRVNATTPVLFARCRNICDFADISQSELEQIIYSTGFYRNKAKNIRGLAKILLEKYEGELPKNMDNLVKLPGIGRKTANVILGDAFGISEGVTVDTHVLRNSHRLGFTVKSQNAVKVERDLMKILPESEWFGFSHRLILLGRSFCVARKPDCENCPLRDVCPKNGI